MAKGSVRKKGKKWYYRFYVDDASGNPVQKEFPGTESKSETESMLRKAMDEYESKKFVAKASNITVGEMLDMWAEEELKPGPLSNGTVSAYLSTIERIKKHPIGSRKLKSVAANHLQDYMDLLSFGGQKPDGTIAKPLAVGTIRPYSAVLRNAFRFAVFPKQLISFNPMDYVVWRYKDDDYEMFTEEDQGSFEEALPTITYEQYMIMSKLLAAKKNPALLPIQIAYYTGLRIGEACALTWQDINLTEQCLTVRRSMRYNSVRKKTEIGPTKRRKIRTVDFCDTLASILKEARREQMLNSMKYGELYRQNYYQTVKEKNRTYYEVYTLQRGVDVPEGYIGISFVCLRMDGAYYYFKKMQCEEIDIKMSEYLFTDDKGTLIHPDTFSKRLRKIYDEIDFPKEFHLHTLRHYFVSAMLHSGVDKQTVADLAGHGDTSFLERTYCHPQTLAKQKAAVGMSNILFDSTSYIDTDGKEQIVKTA